MDMNEMRELFRENRISRNQKIRLDSIAAYKWAKDVISRITAFDYLQIVRNNVLTGKVVVNLKPDLDKLSTVVGFEKEDGAYINLFVPVTSKPNLWKYSQTITSINFSLLESDDTIGFSFEINSEEEAEDDFASSCDQHDFEELAKVFGEDLVEISIDWFKVREAALKSNEDAFN